MDDCLRHSCYYAKMGSETCLAQAVDTKRTMFDQRAA